MDADSIVRIVVLLLTIAPALGAAQKFVTDPLQFGDRPHTRA